MHRQAGVEGNQPAALPARHFDQPGVIHLLMPERMGIEAGRGGGR